MGGYSELHGPVIWVLTRDPLHTHLVYPRQPKGPYFRTFKEGKGPYSGRMKLPMEL